MKKQSSGKNVKEAVFTVEEHLRVQQQIEEHAHALWCAGGCRHDTALNDWLLAEREVSAQFIQVHSEQHSSRHKTTINGFEPGDRRRTIVVKKPQSTLALAASIYEHMV
jgi:hypothetical protein